MFKKISYLICLIFFLVLPFLVFASDSTALKNLQGLGDKGGYSAADENTFSGILGTVVSVVLGFLGIIFIILTIYAGFTWMTAAGNEEKVSRAQSILKRSIIGLIVIVSSYAIYRVIFEWIMGGNAA